MSKEEGNQKMRRRIQLDLSPEAYKRIDEMVTQSGASTRTALIRDALRTYEWLIVQKEKGNRLQAVDSEGEVVGVELLLPFV